MMGKDFNYVGKRKVKEKSLSKCSFTTIKMLSDGSMDGALINQTTWPQSILVNRISDRQIERFRIREENRLDAQLDR